VRALADQPPSDVAESSVSSFVAAHEQCGHGFQIASTRSGLGRLHVVCVGCGERAEYRGDGVAVLGEQGIDAPQARARRFGPSRESMERWLPAPAALPWWVPNAYILGVIAVGLGLIAFGLIHDRRASHAILGTDESHSVAPRPAESAVAPTPAPSPKAKAAPARPKAPDLHRVVVLNRFSLGVPAGWTGGTASGAVVFIAPGREAELRIFLQQGASPPRKLVDRAHAYLAGEHSRAKISAARPLRLGGLKALEVVARFPGGTEHADLLSTGGYSYLILSRVAGDASRSLRADSGAIVRSFRPL
jgi:hypothetical protein